MMLAPLAQTSTAITSLIVIKIHYFCCRKTFEGLISSKKFYFSVRDAVSRKPLQWIEFARTQLVESNSVSEENLRGEESCEAGMKRTTIIIDSFALTFDTSPWKTTFCLVFVSENNYVFISRCYNQMYYFNVATYNQSNILFFFPGVDIYCWSLRQ